MIIISISLFGCGNVANKSNSSKQTTKQERNKEEAKKIEFPKLEKGEVFYKNKKPFGEIIPLKGRHIEGDTSIYKFCEPEFTVKGKYLFVQSLSIAPILVFSYPQLRLLKKVGKFGKGPKEFDFPAYVNSPDTSIYGYLLASRIKTLFKLKKDFSLEKELKPFDVLKGNSNIRFSNAKEIYNVGKEDFVYVSRSKTGKSIYNLSTEKGKSINKEIINLGLNPKRRSSFSYIGSFGVNAKKRRMVYAYKYFKIVKFFDMDTHEIKTINFERETFKENSVYKVNGLDANVTHYWKISTSDKYVYLLYSGRTPVQVGREMMKHKCYIYVEKYDWNGNPISKYKLDRWGYFFADPNDNKIILCSADEDEPFFEYILP